MNRTNDNQPGGRDLIGHSGVQAWSAGPIFPAVISRVETYTDDGVLTGTKWRLLLPEHRPTMHDSYDAARWNARQFVRTTPAEHVHELAARIYAETHHEEAA